VLMSTKITAKIMDGVITYLPRDVVFSTSYTLSRDELWGLMLFVPVDRVNQVVESIIGSGYEISDGSVTVLSRRFKALCPDGGGSSVDCGVEHVMQIHGNGFIKSFLRYVDDGFSPTARGGNYLPIIFEAFALYRNAYNGLHIFLEKRGWVTRILSFYECSIHASPTKLPVSCRDALAVYSMYAYFSTLVTAPDSNP